MGVLGDIAESINVGQQNGRTGGGDPPDVSGGASVDIPGFGSLGFDTGTDFSFGGSPPSVGPSGHGTNGEATMGGQGGFAGAIMSELVQEAIDDSDARAVLEAMQSGALQQMGPIGRPEQVQTPKGTRNVSPPGYRTVYLGGDDDENAFAVLKPLAEAMGLIDDSGPRTTTQKMNDALREWQKWRRKIEKLAPKAGLKTSNRKSGPSKT